MCQVRVRLTPRPASPLSTAADCRSAASRRGRGGAESSLDGRAGKGEKTITMLRTHETVASTGLDSSHDGSEDDESCQARRRLSRQRSRASALNIVIVFSHFPARLACPARRVSDGPQLT